MKVTGHSLTIAIIFGTQLTATVVNCGGQTDGTSQPDSKGGSTGNGGSTGLGGSVAKGGSTGFGGVTVVPPRVPTTHRPDALSCVGVHSPPEPDTSTWYSSSSSCKLHADCTAGANGKCVHGIGMAGGTYYCVYDQCATDAECESGKVCHCNVTTAARCLTIGTCRTDGDCGGAAYGYCSPSMGMDCSGYHSVESYRCHTAADSCMDDTDCSGTDYCNFDVYEARWKCTRINNSCAIG